MAMLPKKIVHAKGQDDHVDAWLMSYADMITLLFMFFVIFVSVVAARHTDATILSHGEAIHPYNKERFGLLTLGTTHDEAFHALEGVVASNNADKDIAIDKSERSMSIDLSTVAFFEPGTADIPSDQLPLLAAIARTLNRDDIGSYSIAVEGYTDDEPVKTNSYANNWELSAMRAARIVGILSKEGINPHRLHAASFAGNHPLVPNKDIQGNPIEQNRQRNQRIVIKVEAPASPLSTLAMGDNPAR